MNNQVIGVLDSGVGGLSVVKEVLQHLPGETIYYLGDTNRCPYGSRSTEEIKTFTFEMISFFMKFPMKAILIACNTITVAALEDMKKELDIPVLGVVEAGVRAAIKATQGKNLGVIATEGTVASGAYEKGLKRINPSFNVFSLACPAFVPLVESGRHLAHNMDQVVAEGLKPLQNLGLNTLILGCTHFPLISDLIQKNIGESVQLIDPGKETAEELKTILSKQGEEKKREPTHRFFTTGSPESFARIVEDWLGQSFPVEKVTLG